MVTQVLAAVLTQAGSQLLQGAVRFGAQYVAAQNSADVALDRQFEQQTFAAEQASLAFRRQIALAGLNAAGSGLVSLARQTGQRNRQDELARVERAFREEQARAERLHREQVAAAERRLKIEQADDAHERQIKLRRIAERDAHYPFDHGPGHLRESFLATYPDPCHRPLLVLLSPVDAAPGRPTPWAGLSERVRADLAKYQDETHAAKICPAQRPLRWPDADLYRGDLAGLPAVVVELGVDREFLSVGIGGCHLVPDALTPLSEVRQVGALRYPRAEEWTAEDIAQLEAGAGGRGVFTLPSPDDAGGLLELNHELAARLITISVMAAVDAYHLMNTPAYDEQSDRVARAAGMAGAAWLPDERIPLDAVRDPAHHLLGRVARVWRTAGAHDQSGRAGTADDDLLLALSLLAGHDEARGDVPFTELLEAAVGGPLVHDRHLHRLAELSTLVPPGSAYAGFTVPARRTPARSPARTGMERGLEYRPDASPLG
ncbi:hypothetical protein [Streptomyces sp. NPDC001348]